MSSQWPYDVFTVAPVWKKDAERIAESAGSVVFSEYIGALKRAEDLRDAGVPCVVRRGDIVFRDGFKGRQ